MAPFMENIAEALTKDNYSGVVSLENFFVPDGGTLEEGYRQSVVGFKKLFGGEQR